MISVHTIDTTMTVTTSNGGTVELEAGDWLELDSDSFDYDRGEVLSVEVGHAVVSWQGSLQRTAETVRSLDGRYIVYGGRPSEWAREWPADTD